MMWATFATLTALTLAPGQAGQLRLTNDRVTFGRFGAVREDAKVLPGDVLFIHFDMENVSVGPDGRVLYSIGMEVLDSQGKRLFHQEPQDQEAINSLGGTRVPAFAQIEVGVDLPPGGYTLNVTVTDRKSNSTQKLSRKFEVLPKGFGIVRLQTISPREEPVPPVAVVGQQIFVDFATVGFERDNKKQPNIVVEMQVLDETGKPTLPKPFPGGTTGEVPPNLLSLRWFFPLSLNRPGRFTVELKATDQIAKKTSQVSFPLTVIDPYAK